MVLIHAERRGGQPAVRSRWLWRLETLARGAWGGAAAGAVLPTRPEIARWAERLDAGARPVPASLRTAERPRPRPPVGVRPRDMAVTRVEEWVRDPYATYARRVLRLRALDRPDAPVEALARGSAIHAAFERFAQDALHPGAEDRFAELLAQELHRAGLPSWRMAREQALAANLARWAVEFERGRRDGAELLVEHKGELNLDLPGGRFRLTAKADRLERRTARTDVLDFKTGAPPSEKQVRAGFAPQLPLTAAILQGGGFAQVGAADPGELLYVRLTGRRRDPGAADPRTARRRDFAHPGAGGAGRPRRARGPLRRSAHALCLLGCAAVPGSLPRRLRPARPGVGVARDGRRRRRRRRGGRGVSAAIPQVQASDPAVDVVVTANAGSGKTSTLVSRVARLLLHGARPEAILCVTYTKAAAAEMQRRLFERLGGWAVADDEALAHALRDIGEAAGDLPRARTLFARALETPGGLKIQTIHAFCEQLLRRFPLEAGVAPGFAVLEDAAQREVSAAARERLAEGALADAEGPLGAAYAHLAAELDLRSFEALLSSFEAQREVVVAYARQAGELGRTLEDDVWWRAGFPDAPQHPEALEDAAALECDWAQWRAASAALALTGASTDAKLSGRLARLAECAATSPGDFSDCWAAFSTAKGEPLKTLGTRALDRDTADWLRREQARLHDACKLATNARQARDTVQALVLATAYASFYEGEKAAEGALDFADLVARAGELLTVRSDAAWVLFKLDGGIEHLLLDEAQDTAPEQWTILDALTEEFLAGEGARPRRELARGTFVVGDPKQSIYSFQGAEPNAFLERTQRYQMRAEAAGRAFTQVPLVESWRSTPQVLAFVDAVFANPDARLLDPPLGDEVVHHLVGGPRRGHTGCVDLWPVLQDEPREEVDAWDAPLDATAPQSAVKRLAARIAGEVKAMIARGDAVFDRVLGSKSDFRPMHAGDVLVLVRRRDALFEEILRALKTARVPVAGADRLRLSEHALFADVRALLRFALYPWDDLTLAELLRSPFCDVDEDGLYALAQPRGEHARLWPELNRRAGERPEWAAAKALLAQVRHEAQAGRTPFDWLSRVLTLQDARCLTMRQRLLTRLGAEAQDALEALLAEALAAEGPRRARPGAFLRRAGARRDRGEARAGGRRRGGAGDDRARRQGAGGACGDPARHPGPRARTLAPAARHRGRRPRLRAPGLKRHARQPRGQGRAQGAPGAGGAAAALRGPHPRPRPADRLRPPARQPHPARRRQLVRPGAGRLRPGGHRRARAHGGRGRPRHPPLRGPIRRRRSPSPPSPSPSRPIRPG